MDFPSAPIIGSNTPLAQSAGTPVHHGQGGKPFSSAGAGKSFSSVLHSVSGHQQNNMLDTQDSHPPKRADQALSSAPTTVPSGREDADPDPDQPVVREEADDQSSKVASTAEPATQALLVASVTVPMAEPTSQPAPDAASLLAAPVVCDQGTIPSIIPVMPKGTVIAGGSPPEAESSQTAFAEDAAAVSTVPLQPDIPTAPPKTTTDELVPSPASQKASPLQTAGIPAPQEARDAQKAVSKDVPLKNEQPSPAAPEPSQAQPVAQEAAPALAPEQEIRTADPELAQSTRAQDQPVIPKRSEPSPEPAQTEKEPASHDAAGAQMVWQSLSGEQQAQDGSDHTGRERRDRQAGELSLEAGGPAPSAAPFQSFYTGLPSSVGDSKMPASSASSASVSSTPQPVAALAAQPVDWMPEPSGNHTRSVVLEVAQADLGRVNIRVSMNQDVVHTHFSADRSEVGQFLIKEQDKLQTAFQNSGLDMGQFRVDIDRQSAGRSFQQHTPQGQGYSYTPYREGRLQGQSNEPALAEASNRRGMLNLVA